MVRDRQMLNIREENDGVKVDNLRQLKVIIALTHHYLWVRVTDLEKPRAVQPGSHNITKISDVLGLETH